MFSKKMRPVRYNVYKYRGVEFELYSEMIIRYNVYKYRGVEFELYSEMIIQDGDRQLNNVFLKVRPVRYILYKYRGVESESYSEMMI